MKRLLLATMVATLVSASTGCCLLDRLLCRTREYPVPMRQGRACGPACGPVCDECGPDGLGHRGGGLRGAMAAKHASKYSGPATGAVTYPYYTTRGPRDFLASNPRDIGP